jgi:ankyrin repeat protein
MRAAYYNRLDSVKLLLDSGKAELYQQDDSSNTALYFAVCGSSVDVVKYLLAKSAGNAIIAMKIIGVR